MRKHLTAIAIAAGSVLAFGNVAAAEKPGYVYDTYGAPAKDTWGECVKSVYRQKDAYPECEGQAAVAVKDKLTLDGRTHFDFDKSNLKPAGREALDNLVAGMKGHEVKAVEVVGHTDSVGSDAYNKALGQRRANTVKGYLVDRGVPASVISTSSAGESQPVASNSTAEGRAQNRRAEIEVTKVKK
jgi:OOP family OmpA-OmpF porin